MLELTGTALRGKEQILDTLEVERQRGITVRAQTATMRYKYKEDQYLLNLIDTPGHVDFSYQVDRSLRACQGALLLVDATKGVQAQTVANLHKAIDAGLTIIPVINKIDLPSSNIELTMTQLTNSVFMEDEVCLISAKTGQGVQKLLKEIVERFKAPQELSESALRALLFDAQFVKDKGVLCMLAVLSGSLKKGQALMSYHSNKRYDIFEVGVVTPELKITDYIGAGQVGYFFSNMKSVADANIGDTFYSLGDSKSNVKPFPGFKRPQPMVFAGMYPEDPGDYEELDKALDKLMMTDGSVTKQYQSSAALGNGFRMGFLGMLHMDVFRQRLIDQHSIVAIITTPSVAFQAVLKPGVELSESQKHFLIQETHLENNKLCQILKIENALSAPAAQKLLFWRQPVVRATILTPKEYLEYIEKLCHYRRGVKTGEEKMGDQTIQLIYQLPLAQIADDFFDKLKSCSKGYASLDYEHLCYRKEDIKKLTILIHGQAIDALSFLVHESKAIDLAKEQVKKLKQAIPPALFSIAVQASLGKRIVARQDIKAKRKNVTAKCYGGDYSRKKKLLDRQKEGKKKMRTLGNIQVSSDTFLALLKR